MRNYQSTPTMSRPTTLSKLTWAILLISASSILVGVMFSLSLNLLSPSRASVGIGIACVLAAIRFWRQGFWVALAISGYIVVLWLRNVSGIENELITPITYLIAAAGAIIGQVYYAAASKEKMTVAANFGLFIAIAIMVYLYWILSGMPAHSLIKIQLFSVIVVPICIFTMWRLNELFWTQTLNYLIFFGVVMLGVGAYYLLNANSFIRFSLNDTIDVLSLARIYSYAAIAAVGVAIIEYRERKTGSPKFWMLLALSAVFVFGIMLTGTRAATILVPIIITAMLFLSRQEFSLGLFSTIVRITLLSVITLFLAQRFLPDITLNRLSTVTLDDVSVRGGRSHLYSSAIEVWQRSPLIGSGVAGFDRYTGLNYPHNSFLEFATDFGLIGLVLYIAFIVTTFVYIGRIWQQQQSRQLLIVYAALFINALLRAQFSSTIYGVSTVWLFALLIGRLYLDYPREESDPDQLQPGSAT